MKNPCKTFALLGRPDWHPRVKRPADRYKTWQTNAQDLGEQWVEAMQQQQQPHNEEALKLRRRVLKLQFEMALYTAFVIDRVSDMASMAVADFLVDEVFLAMLLLWWHCSH